MGNIAPYYKAVVAFITPGVVALVAAVTDASPAGAHVTGPEWIGIAAACILSGGVTYAIPNAAKRDKSGRFE